MTNDQLTQGFVVCQERRFARQGKAQLGCAFFDCFANQCCILKQLYAGRIRNKL